MPYPGEYPDDYYEAAGFVWDDVDTTDDTREDDEKAIEDMRRLSGSRDWWRS